MVVGWWGYRRPTAELAGENQLVNTFSVSEPPLHLILYTSPLSRYGLAAQRNCSALLDRFDRRQIHFEICDVSRHPERADEDSVCFTPTLVRRCPLPRLYVMGDMSNIDALADLLGASGAEPIR
jgi:hypothetical protein